MTSGQATAPGGNPLMELQQAIYASGNYTRRRLHQTRLRWVADAIARHARDIPVSRAIEYGPGSGVYLAPLARACDEVVAADVEHAYLSGLAPVAQQLPNVALLEDDIEDSRLPDRHFGLVLCSEVLEHVRSPERALRTLHRILRPGGLAVVTTPQRHSVMEACCKVAFLPGVIQLVRAIYREPVLPTGHISLRTSRQLRWAIGAAGFHIEEQARFGLYLPVLAELGGDAGGRLIERLERRLQGTPLEELLWTQAYVLRRPDGC